MFEMLYNNRSEVGVGSYESDYYITQLAIWLELFIFAFP